MGIDCYRFNFSSGKFKSFARAELVRDLAGDFNFGRTVYDEKKKRRRLLRLVRREKDGRKEIKNKKQGFPGLVFLFIPHLARILRCWRPG